MKRKLAFLLSFCAAIILFAGCKDSDAPDDEIYKNLVVGKWESNLDLKDGVSTSAESGRYYKQIYSFNPDGSAVLDVYTSAPSGTTTTPKPNDTYEGSFQASAGRLVFESSNVYVSYTISQINEKDMVLTYPATDGSVYETHYAKITD